MKKKIYEEIRFLTNLIGTMNLPEILLEAAKGKDEEQMEEFLLKFKRANHSKLWGRVDALSEEYTVVVDRPTIFYTAEAVQDAEDYDVYMDNGLVLYNPEEIKPINLCILMTLADGAIDDDDLFVEYSQFTEYVSKLTEQIT